MSTSPLSTASPSTTKPARSPAASEPQAAPALDALWYTRCPVPTALGIAVSLGFFSDEFKPDGLTLKSLQETSDPELRESHFDHRLPASFRQGGNIPAIWARARGADTRLVGLSWIDEFQGIIALPGSGVRSIADLAGRRLGLPKHQVSIDFQRATALRAYETALGLEGIGVGQVELVDLVEPPRRAAAGNTTGGGKREIGWESSRNRLAYGNEVRALVGRHVDAVYVKGARGLEVASYLGAQVLYDLNKHPDPRVRISNATPRTLTVDRALLDSHPDLVARFVRRVVEAGAWAEAHVDQTVAYIARESHSTEHWVREAYGPDVHRHLKTDLPDAWIDALDEFKGFLLRTGFLAADFDLRAWVDRRPLEALEAHRRVA